ncbi:MAG: ABC transporter ATP-binding protein [Bacillota bacterium]
MGGEVQVHALWGVNLQISPGEMLAIMGPSGSGKSTLMHILGCLDRPTSGQYLLEGQDVREKTDNELAALRNRYLGFVFQEFNLLPGMTAMENVILPLTYRPMGARERLERAREALVQVGLADRLSHRPNQLSGGQQQRVAIARSLATRPSVLLADEPTGNLDSTAQEELMQFIGQLNERGMTVVVVTHEKAVADHCRRVIQLLDGEIISDAGAERTVTP